MARRRKPSDNSPDDPNDVARPAGDDTGPSTPGEREPEGMSEPPKSKRNFPWSKNVTRPGHAIGIGLGGPVDDDGTAEPSDAPDGPPGGDTPDPAPDDSWFTNMTQPGHAIGIGLGGPSEGPDDRPSAEGSPSDPPKVSRSHPEILARHKNMTQPGRGVGFALGAPALGDGSPGHHQDANPNRLETEEDRQRILRRLREEYGDQWLKENQARLDREWEMLKDF